MKREKNEGEREKNGGQRETYTILRVLVMVTLTMKGMVMIITKILILEILTLMR